MTVPIRPDATRVKAMPPRVLSPDEFDQARTMTPEAIQSMKFPAAPPPFAPRDATSAGDPPKNPNAKELTGLARILTQYVAQPILDHPLLTAGILGSQAVPVVGPAIDYAFMGLMGKNVLEYSAQKAAEQSFDAETQKKLEADKSRISGEEAAVNAVMLGAPALLRAGAKRIVGHAVEPAPAAGAVTEPLADWNPETMGAKPAPEELAALRTTATDALLQHRPAEAPTPAAGSGEAAPVAPDAAETARLQVATKGHADSVADAWLRIFAPASRTDDATAAANIIRASTGQSAGEYEQAAFQLDDFRRAIEPLPDADKLGFIDAIEGGKSQASPEFQAAADVIRKTLDDTREEIQGLGTGKLEKFIEDYFPHIWEDPEKAGEAFKAAAARRPFEGGKSFLKQRTIPTTAEGMALGLKPVSMNPVDLTLLKLREMQRYLTAHRALNEMKDAGLVKYVRAGDVAPEGYGRINDRVATVFGKPTVTIEESFDAGQRASIEKAIQTLGIKHERKVSLGGQTGLSAGALGYAKGTREIASKFGTHDGVIMHELGHILDARYDLQGQFRGAGLAKELEQLAALRAEHSPTASADFHAYLQKPEEQVANALHAYLHAPERMAEVAPKTQRFLERFLASHPELDVVRDIKPSLALATGTAEKPVGGLVIRGEYWAPEAVAKVVNNHLSPGLRGNAIYDAFRGLGNSLNQAQLGLSAFHLGFTSMDATVSRAALGLEHIASGKPIAGLGEIASAPAAPITNAMLGAKIRRAYLNPESSTPDMVALATAVKEAGGRVRMDSFYKNSAPERLSKALKEGRPVDAAALTIPALLEQISKPIMEHVVPLQKLGIFGDLASKILGELPADATLADRRAALAKAWDSVDNRMGQVVYDNLFWNRTFKDAAMAGVRSVGWNLGTIRELGGGALDLAGMVAQGAQGKRPVLTHPAAYVMALPMMVAMYSAVYQMLRTGQGPQEFKDYAYPKTGELDADGNPERVQVPSYMKDLFAYAGHPWETIKHKVSPAFAMTYEMLQNQDYYGDQIRNADDPLVKQLQQEASYVAGQTVPFAVRNLLESKSRGDESGASQLQGFFGITPAPRSIVRSDAQNEMMKYLAERKMSGATPEDAEARRSRAQLVMALRDNADGSNTQEITDAVTAAIERHQLAPKDVVHLLKLAGSTPAKERFKRLTLPEAIDVFQRSTPEEKAMFAEVFLAKLAHQRSGAIATAGEPQQP